MPFCFHKVERKKKVWSYLVFHGRVHTIFLVPVRLPIPAYLLALSYFFLSLLSLSMLVGLRTKRTRLLLAWILINLLVICPEAGMVLFMAVYYWVSNYRMSQQVLDRERFAKNLSRSQKIKKFVKGCLRSNSRSLQFDEFIWQIICIKIRNNNSRIWHFRKKVFIQIRIFGVKIQLSSKKTGVFSKKAPRKKTRHSFSWKVFHAECIIPSTNVSRK